MKKQTNYNSTIDLDRVTLEDCLDLYQKKNMYTILSSGRIIDFNKEETKEN